jgi:predicted helicase
MFGYNYKKKNTIISINSNGKDFYVLASNNLIDLHFTGDSKCISFKQYSLPNEEPIDNITNWGLQQFQNHYTSLREGTTKQSENNTNEPSSPVCYANSNEVREEFKMEIASPDFDRDRKDEITKENIFHYVYAVLHNPAYRKKYELNLKREFPRIPFYDNFFQWAAWGKQLMDLHINYETVETYPLTELVSEYNVMNEEQFAKLFRPKLKANKEKGTIEIDAFTTLQDIPSIAWEYKLGNRSALEWILDQYKEKKPSDPTIAEKFNTYRFADYKEHVIDLLTRVCTVSVETIKVVREMEKG